jgi:hypothetical protein
LERVVKPLALAFIGMLVLAAPSIAAVTVGSDLTADFYAGVPGLSCDAAVPCSWLTLRSQASLPQVAPFYGVVVRWRLRSLDNGYARLQVIAPGPGDDATALRNSSVREAVHPGLNIFEDRLPIEAGATVGIDDSPGGWRYFGIAQQSAHIAWFGQPLNPLYQAYGPSGPTGTGTGLELLMNADVEPDADHDGYGDQTQDACPTDASTHGQCPPPTTKPAVTPSPLPISPTLPVIVGRPLPPNSSTPPVVVAPACTASFRPRYRLRQVLRTGIVGTAHFRAAGAVTATALIGSTVAARGRASLSRPGATRFTVHLTRSGKGKLRHMRQGHLTIKLSFADEARAGARGTSRVTLSR